MTKLNERRMEKLEGVAKNSFVYKCLFDLLMNGGKVIRPVYTTGSGRHTKLSDHLLDVEIKLLSMGIRYIVKNDAPRGGRCGTYIELFRAISGYKTEITVWNVGRRFN